MLGQNSAGSLTKSWPVAMCYMMVILFICINALNKLISYTAYIHNYITLATSVKFTANKNIGLEITLEFSLSQMSI